MDCAPCIHIDSTWILYRRHIECARGNRISSHRLKSHIVRGQARCIRSECSDYLTIRIDKINGTGCQNITYHHVWRGKLDRTPCTHIDGTRITQRRDIQRTRRNRITRHRLKSHIIRSQPRCIGRECGDHLAIRIDKI